MEDKEKLIESIFAYAKFIFENAILDFGFLEVDSYVKYAKIYNRLNCYGYIMIRLSPSESILYITHRESKTDSSEITSISLNNFNFEEYCNEMDKLLAIFINQQFELSI